MATKRINSFSEAFRYVTPIMLSLIIFIGNQMSADIREIRKDIYALRNEVVYEKDYHMDKKEFHEGIQKLNKICTDIRIAMGVR